MRIAHITPTFPPYMAGTSSVCYYNALGLAQVGHEVTVFTADYPPGEYRYPPEMTVKRLPVLFRIGAAPLLPDLLRIDGFDLVHLHHPFIFGAELTWTLSKTRKIPYIITHHNDLVGVGLRRHLFNLYTAFSAPLIFGGARKLGVVSLDWAASCRMTPQFQKRWSDVVEIPNGVDTDQFRLGLDGASERRQQGIPQDGQVVMFVGALDRSHPNKGVEYLLQAIALIPDRRIRLMVVGDGDAKRDYMDLADALQLNDRATFPGMISHQHLPHFIAAADLFVLPSIRSESFGMVLIEAMACGVPVVASNLPGVRSVVSDGEDGLLVTPGDAGELAQKIEWTLEHPDLSREMGARGRAKGEERYAWPVILPRLAQVYENVLAHERQQPAAIRSGRPDLGGKDNQ